MAKAALEAESYLGLYEGVKGKSICLSHQLPPMYWTINYYSMLFSVWYEVFDPYLNYLNWIKISRRDMGMCGGGLIL